MDVWNSVSKIKRGLREGKMIIADRYITSTLAYRDAKGFTMSNGLKIVDILGFPSADLIIFLDIDPKTSAKRKLEEKGTLDLYEEDVDYLRRVKESYEKEIKKNIMGKWAVVNGEKSKEAVHKEILKLISSRFKNIKSA
jgi:thymidylate kinase